MLRRTLTVSGAAAFAAVALVATATPAAAQEFCNVTTGGPFDGTYVCVVTDSIITGYKDYPYSVGAICFGGVCTVPQSGTVRVPNSVDTSPVAVYGTLCVPTIKQQQICVPFDSRTISVVLPPLA